MEEAIVLQDTILVNGMAYPITERNANGTVIALKHTHWTAIAVFMPAVIKRRHTLRPIVGRFSSKGGQNGTGLVYPSTEWRACSLESWQQAVRAMPRLEWHHVLKSQVAFAETIKVTLINWSFDDLGKIRERQWFVGFSATSSLLRLYMLVPRLVWESDPNAAGMPVFDGQVHQVQRFGAILAPATDRCTWRRAPQRGH